MTATARRAPDDQVRVLDEDGEVVDGTEVPDPDDGTLVGTYRDIRLARRFDQRAVSLQRQGRVAAVLQEEALLYQEAPIGRVTGFDTPFPLYAMEDYYRPNPARIVDGVRGVMAQP